MNNVKLKVMITTRNERIPVSKSLVDGYNEAHAVRVVNEEEGIVQRGFVRFIRVPDHLFGVAAMDGAECLSIGSAQFVSVNWYLVHFEMEEGKLGKYRYYNGQKDKKAYTLR